MTRRSVVLVSVIGLLALCCLLVVAGGLGYFLWPRRPSRPTVFIRSPSHGEQVEVGEEVTVRSVARDERKVVRVELWIDGQLREAQRSRLPGGVSPFPLLARWRPSSPGTHTLTARAFNAQGGRASASVNVEAMEARADRDGDGVTDVADQCPDEPGPEAARGCPDGDGDSVPDYLDDCPDEPGTPVTEGCPDADGDAIPDGIDACPEEPGAPGAPEGDGCPAPTDEDRDGDGTPDAEDESPDDPGSPFADGSPDADGDGVADSEDECPAEAGPPEHDGCPGPVEVVDTDHDGIPDEDDDCPDEAGPAEHDGCPDSDGDGIPDDEDACDEEPGPRPSGCPDTGEPDSDGDGCTDEIDPCPHEAGRLEDDCCPPPPFDPVPPGGGWEPVPGVPGFRGLPLEEMTLVEFEALEFEVSGDYDEIWCYLGVGTPDEPNAIVEDIGPWRPSPGERYWNLAEVLGEGRSRSFLWAEDVPMHVHLECNAEAGLLGLPEPHPLGEYASDHPRSDWAGHVLPPARSERWPGGEDSFQARYRICTPSCEVGAVPPPRLTLTSVGPPGGPPWDYLLNWSWDGDEEAITGFRVWKVCERMGVGSGRDVPVDWRSLSSLLTPGLFSLPCGDRCRYTVRAYSELPGPEYELYPPSNPVVLEGEPCPLPDLTPTDVTVHEPSRQLRIHVLNEGGPLRSEDITVNLVRISTNEQIAIPTWEDVSIPAGGIYFLQTGEAVEPWDLRVIVDPANEIEEMDEGNNIYETPVVMRVEFLSVYSPFCGEGWGCSIFSCDSEHYFDLLVGHGPTQSDVTWDVWDIFPPSGVLESRCTDLRGCDESPSEAWRMEGDERYTHDIEVSADENLYVKVTGMEDDTFRDDLVGRLIFEYTPAQNWGARPDSYAERTSDMCVQARWRITRVH